MFETKTVKNNKVIEVTKIKITIPFLDWEKDNIFCFSTNRELIYMAIFKRILMSHPNFDRSMRERLFMLIVTASDISELDKCLFEEWDISNIQLNFYTWRLCNSYETNSFMESKRNRIFDRINGDLDRIYRDYQAAQYSSVEGFLSALSKNKIK